MAKDTSLIPPERIEKAILLLRGQKIMLDRDLAELYEVSTKVLNQAVKRNLKRFPDDFMFQLNWEEVEQLSRSQAVTLKRGRNIKSDLTSLRLYRVRRGNAFQRPKQ